MPHARLVLAGLARFSEFFSAPLFTESATGREARTRSTNDRTRSRDHPKANAGPRHAKALPSGPSRAARTRPTADIAVQVSAIESEHAKNLQSDSWRAQELLKTSMRRDHPFSRFFTGNREVRRDAR